MSWGWWCAWCWRADDKLPISWVGNLWWALYGSVVCLMDTHRHGKSSCATSLAAPEVSYCSPRPATLGSHCNIFVYIFFFNGAPSTIKDECQKDVKYTFLTSYTAFGRTSHQKVFSPWIIPCCNTFLPLNIFSFFDQCYSVSTNYKQIITQVKPAQRYGKISTSLILVGIYKSICTYQKRKANKAGKAT